MAVSRFAILLLLCRPVFGIQKSITLNQQWAYHQRCVDMNGYHSFQPTTASSIIVTLDAATEGLVSVVVFELGDEHLGGIRVPGTDGKEIFCNPQNVERKLCEEKEIGTFLITDHARAKAKYPMITRAINLTKPIAIAYPVQGSGYFCAATYGYSATSYSGTLLAIDTNGILPAFRDSLRAVYVYLMPLWILLGLIWTRLITDLALTQPVVPSIGALGILSIAQVAFRWGALQLGESKAASTLQIVWYGLEMGQNSLVMFIIHKLVTGSETSPLGNKTSGIFKKVLSCAYLAASPVIFLLASLTDFVATAESTRSAFVNIFLGFYLLVGAATAAFVLDRRRTTIQEHERGSLSADIVSRKPLSIMLLVLCVMIIAILAFNIWAVAKVGGDGVKFAHMFWRSRFGLIDMPYEPLFLILVAVLLGLYIYQAQKYDELTDMSDACVETEGLMSYKPVSMESSGSAEFDEKEEK